MTSSISINKELNCLRRQDSCSGHTQPASDSSEDTTPTTADDGCSSSSGVWGGEGGQCYEDSLSIVSSICDNNCNSMQNNRQHQHHRDNNNGFALPPSPMDNILPPLRPLTDEEHSHIFLLLHDILNFENAECQIQAERDAADMITYTCEMIDAKMRVGYIIEEMDFMDLDICSPTTVLIEMRKCLAVYLSQLEDDDVDDDKRKSQAVPQDEDEARVFAMAAAAAARRASLEDEVVFPDDKDDEEDNCHEKEPITIMELSTSTAGQQEEPLAKKDTNMKRTIF